jgi:group I intron endonuclease
MIGIYKITSPNNKIYIGQTIDFNIRLLTYNNINQSKCQTKLHYSFLKYGIVNHIFEFIEECSIDQLNIKERYWQDHYNVLSTKGLNCKLTQTNDKSGSLSEEVKLKISIGNKGKKRSAETKLKISQFMKNKVCSEQTKLKISLANKGKVISKEHKEILKNARKNEIHSNVGKKRSDNHLAKKVICTDTNKIWNCMSDCAEELNISVKTLSKYLTGYRKNKTTIIYYE